MGVTLKNFVSGLQLSDTLLKSPVKSQVFQTRSYNISKARKAMIFTLSRHLGKTGAFDSEATFA